MTADRKFGFENQEDCDGPKTADAVPSEPAQSDAGRSIANQEALFPPLPTIRQEHWDKARARYEAIKEALKAGPPFLPHIQTASKKYGCGVSTLYRLIERYRDTGDMRSLINRGIGEPRRSRLDPQVLSVMSEVFQAKYLAVQRPQESVICREVRMTCRRDGLPPPHPNTIRKHLKRLRAKLGHRTFHKRRGSKKIADALFTPHQGVYNDADAPWSIVQIDHTHMDVMLVDEHDRECIGRAFVTMAEDVFSRMVLGFYVSFDPVGTLSTGLCLYHAMLPKESWLRERGITNPWPCWGKPVALHFDNAKEFLGKTLQRFGELYDVRREHRPLGASHYGGHIERLIRTASQELHRLPGTTFSNVQSRGEYESEKLACMTLRECETFLAEWITGVYHRRIHTALGRTPQTVYENAIHGSPDTLGIGRRAMDIDEKQLRLDLLPFQWRTVQRSGIIWDKLVYVGEVLGPYTGAVDDRGSSKRFIVARDPRRITEAYFFAPDVKEYFVLKLRNPTRPNISVWEWNELRRRLAAAGKKDEDEDAIFASYAKQQQLIDEATSKTKVQRRARTRRRHHAIVGAQEDARPLGSVDWDPNVEPFEGSRAWNPI
jgi:putative transposase